MPADDDLELAEARLGFEFLSKLLTAARKRAKEHGREIPSTVSEFGQGKA
jgi:hypothetical protein